MVRNDFVFRSHNFLLLNVFYYWFCNKAQPIQCLKTTYFISLEWEAWSAMSLAKLEVRAGRDSCRGSRLSQLPGAPYSRAPPSPQGLVELSSHLITVSGLFCLLLLHRDTLRLSGPARILRVVLFKICWLVALNFSLTHDPGIRVWTSLESRYSARHTQFSSFWILAFYFLFVRTSSTPSVWD